MKPIFKNYTPDDFLRIRDFLVSTYPIVGKEYNWSIERLNFALSMARIMNGISAEEWGQAVGIWEEDGAIIAVANAEGEGSGESFFQVRDKNLSAELLNEMFEFAETHHVIEKDGEHIIYHFIPENDELRKSVAVERGFTQTEWSETISVLDIKDRPEVGLPEGFTVKTGLEVTNVEHGLAHAKAFGYIDEEEYVGRSKRGFDIMRAMPDYRADLDLFIVSESGEIASFCTIWYDQVNKIGILEPVGTNADYQRLGLARAIIAEAVERVVNEGATKVYVGSGIDFYLSIGFKKLYMFNIWEKSVNK